MSSGTEGIAPTEQTKGNDTALTLGKDGKAAEDAKPPSMSYFALFKNADSFDFLLLFLGSIGAVVAGAGWPAWTFIFGEIVDVFGKGGTNLSKKVNELAAYMVIIAAAVLVGGYLQVACFTITGNRQATRLRAKFMRAALLQNISFFDVEAKTGNLLQGLNNDNAAVQKGVGEKVGHFLQFFSCFIIGFVIAFARGWDLTLVVLATMPIIAPSGLLMSRILAKASIKIDAHLSQANSLASEAVANIRTVAAFNQQDRIVTEFDKHLIVPAQQGFTTGIGTGIGFGTFYLWFWGTFGLGLYYGALRVYDGKMTGGQVLNVFIASMVGGFNFGQSLPQLQYFSEAASAGARIFAVINRKPDFSITDGGETLGKVDGKLSLKNVAFHYPSRPDTIIFRDISLEIPAGKQVALVGGTGSGKSTVISLVQRFYDPVAGSVMFDGVDIRRLDLTWLRKQMGLVNQEPTLFATTIRENIALGVDFEVTDDQIEDAAKAANVHKFVSQLPEGYNTQVGERGVQLSGGQKQRIAIARAVLRNPRILLLDEATSALDTTSERVVQAALNGLMTGRTTVVVAHRLSTIIHADIIAVVRDGVIAEQGSHEQLLEIPGGVYKALVKLQDLESPQDEAAAGPEDPDAVVLETAGSHNEAARKSVDRLGRRHSKEVELMAVAHAAATIPEGAIAEDVETGKEAKQPPKGSFVRLLKLNAPEWYFAVIGCFCAVIVGAMMPSISFLLGEAIGNFFKARDKLKPAMAQVAGYMALVAGCAFLATLVQQVALGIMGARLARRVRAMLLRSILSQEIAFFDDDAHSSAALISRLSSDSAYVRGAVGDTLSVITQSVTVLLYANILALALGWKLALVVLGTVPLVAAGAIIEARLMVAFLATSSDAYATANQTASESFSSVRVVQSYGLEDTLVGMYEKKLEVPMKASTKSANISGMGFGYSQGVIHAVYALAFWYGAKLVTDGEMTFDAMFKVIFAVLMGALGLAQAQMVFPDMGKAQEAVANVFSILDRKPKIDSVGDDVGNKPSSLKGAIELVNVEFSYPARPGVIIFNGFSIKVNPGQSMALVGESGSGKSTIIGLVLRYYDPLSGSVKVDGIDIKQYNLKALRQLIALVGQEPVLFQGTIRENILYGRPGASKEEVEDAARIANATEFISRINGGFDTQVGERGGQMSGGQKQRIAIARAVLRNPRILLLDEATSALDASSEALVQEALDRLMEGRTTVIVAHRLSTIRNADCISVLSRGQVVEQGSHDHLLAQNGAYSQLVKAQMKKSPSSAAMA